MTPPVWHHLVFSDVIAQLGTRPEGLTENEVAARLALSGRNEIIRHKPINPWRLLFKQFANYFIFVLLFAAILAFTVSYLPGESGRRLTAYFILGIIVLSVALSFFEDYRAQKELEALDRLLVFKTTVRRAGSSQQVEAAEVVPGDILVMTHGQKVPADARLIEVHSLRTDESALTGESVGVDKSPEPVAPDAALAERTSMVYASTYITHGTGQAVAVSTGMATEVGQIAGTLGQMAERPTPFQVEVQKMARQMTIIVASLAAVVAIVLLFLLHEPPVDVALNTLSLAIATIPESLPIVLTFALALGARQMARRNAVVRRLSVVESLGSVDTICTDKTGTLTQNLMTVQRLDVGGQMVDISQGIKENRAALELLRAAILCNEATVAKGVDSEVHGDPVDTALVKVAQLAGLDPEQARKDTPRVNEIPFSSERKMMTTIHMQNGRQVAITKGAPGPVLAHCTCCQEGTQEYALADSHCQAIRHRVTELQSQGFYVLGVASRELPEGVSVDQAENEMTFLGLLALIDPPRPGAAEAITRAQGAGIRVVMITGDNGLTAQAIAATLGIGGRVMDAREMGAITAPALIEKMKEVDIVARATPQVKQQVLQALQNAGHVVAMTGDGVNDATALKQSDVGVAMGLRGTDIAKESSAMVLLDDNFSTIVAAIEEGRRIFDNIRKFTNYLLSTSLGEVFVVLALSITGYFPLSAIMLLWVNVVTDLVPASALAADPVVPHVMKRRPRRHDEPILNKAIYATIVGSIFRTLIAYGLIFWVGLQFGGVTYARSMLFTSIVLHAFTRVMVVRQMDSLSLWSNRALLISYALAVGLQLLALYTPMRSLFGVIPLDWRAWAVMIPVTAGSSLAGVYMTRWILKLFPMWEK
ncbi:MAG: cation-transporting P-type ATPase [Anaerolineales bacterium]|jgi:Ca2+-transporting ATPase